MSEQDNERGEEQWDCYYHELLLHSSRHQDMCWYRDTWWWPIDERVTASPDLFHCSGGGGAGQMKYYDLLLPGGGSLQDFCYVYIGDGTEEDWLEGYIAYNLNLVTVDQRAP